MYYCCRPSTHIPRERSVLYEPTIALSFFAAGAPPDSTVTFSGHGAKKCGLVLNTQPLQMSGRLAGGLCCVLLLLRAVCCEWCASAFVLLYVACFVLFCDMCHMCHVCGFCEDLVALLHVFICTCVYVFCLWTMSFVLYGQSRPTQRVL